MAENNAKITLDNKAKDKYDVLTELKEVLKSIATTLEVEVKYY